MAAAADTLSFGYDGRPWKVAAASVIGPNHISGNLPNQDAFCVLAEGDALVVSVSDGAGSAAEADTGAQFVSVRVAAALRARLPILKTDSKAAVMDALHEARDGLVALAATAQRPLSDYHATVVAAVVDGEGNGIIVHIGDGSVLAIGREGDATPDWASATISLPENGEFANETYFLTLEFWTETVRVTEIRGVNALMVMTDGASAFAVSSTGEPIIGFLSTVDNYLQQADAKKGAEALAVSLSSGRACSNPDDKTIVWARRR